MIKISAKNLNLESTLFNGQVFRWQKINEKYYGFISNKFVSIENKNGMLYVWPKQPISTDEIKEYFRLGDDLEKVKKSIGNDSVLSMLFEYYNSMRIIKQEPLECSISYICSIASNIRKISSVINKISQMSGYEVELDGIKNYSFPTYDELIKLTKKDFDMAGAGFRSEYILNFLKYVGENKETFYSLDKLPYEEALKTLTSIRGIGDKVANCILLFGFGKLEAFPVDRWVLRAMKKFYVEQKMSNEKIRQFAQNKWDGNAGYIQQYLFHGIRNGLV
ncbi:MAG: DNA-3-methyladenine glycosylase family protein [Thermoplasmata archaeon]